MILSTAIFYSVLLIFCLNGLGANAQDLKSLEKAVEVNPQDLQKHQIFLNAFHKRKSFRMDANFQDLIAIYDQWITRYPKNPMVPYAIGKFFKDIERPEAKDYMLKAVAIKPDFAEAWSTLRLDAMYRANKKEAAEMARLAYHADRSNALSLYNYGMSLDELNDPKADSVLLEAALRFPESEGGSKGLFYLLYKATYDAKRLAYGEQLHKRFSKVGGGAFRSGMTSYFSTLINAGKADEAFRVALDMTFIMTENKLEWKHKLKVADQFISLDRKSSELGLDSMIAMIDKIELRDGFSNSSVDAGEKIAILKSELLDKNLKSIDAYETLLKQYLSRPTLKIKKLLFQYGVKAGIDSANVTKNMLSKHRLKPEPAAKFSLFKYGTDEKVTLEDLKGKVVMLTYWFPGCGPCRAEFPHFENVLKKFSKDEVVYLGINAYPEQDLYVKDFMAYSGFTFIPLKIDKGWDPGNLAAFAYPTNFLIDKEGRLAYTRFFIRKDNEDYLEMMIKDLLATK